MIGLSTGTMDKIDELQARHDELAAWRRELDVAFFGLRVTPGGKDRPQASSLRMQINSVCAEMRSIEGEIDALLDGNG